MGSKRRNPPANAPAPRAVRDALRTALIAAYGGRLRTALEELGIHGSWNQWARGLPAGATLQRLAPALARVGVTLDDVLLRPHVVQSRISVATAVERFRPAQGADAGELQLWDRIQGAIATTPAPEQVKVHIELCSPAEQLLYRQKAGDPDIAVHRAEQIKRQKRVPVRQEGDRKRAIGAAQRIMATHRRAPVVLVVGKAPQRFTWWEWPPVSTTG